MLCSGVLSQTTETTITGWSVILPQRLGVAVYVATTTLKTNSRLKGQYALEGDPSRRRFRVRDRILAPHIAIGSASGSPVTGEHICSTGGSAGAYVYLDYLHTRLGVS
jgi:hypothetical protein